jgi:hypothetical protein
LRPAKQVPGYNAHALCCAFYLLSCTYTFSRCVLSFERLK